MNDDRISPDFGNSQPSTTQWVLIFVFGLVTICGVVLFLGGGALSIYTYLNSQSALPAEALPAVSPTPDYRLSALQTAQSWPLLLLDPFDENQNEWIEESIDDEYAAIDVSIDGTYNWEVLAAKQGFVWRVWPAIDELRDFYLAVDAQNRSDNDDAQYGLIFRNQGDDHYYFEVRDSQYFRLFLYQSYQWKELLPYTFSDAIQPGGVNRLAVLSQDNEFTLWINDQFVGQARGNDPVQGQAGLIIGLAEAGESALIAFDNFEVRVPQLPAESP